MNYVKFYRINIHKSKTEHNTIIFYKIEAKILVIISLFLNKRKEIFKK